MPKKAKIIRYNKIKVALAEAGKRNADLAQYMAVGPSTVSDWCTNTNQPSIERLYKIAAFLKIDVAKLLVPNTWGNNDQLTQAAEDETTPSKKTKKKTRNPK